MRFGPKAVIRLFPLLCSLSAFFFAWRSGAVHQPKADFGDVYARMTMCTRNSHEALAQMLITLQSFGRRQKHNVV